MPKVLVLDDDLHLLNLTSNWLRNNLFTVDATSDSVDCQKLLLKSVYDVVVLDWHLSNSTQTGVNICNWFRLRGGKTPILILSESSLIDDKELAFNCGADDYLTKPGNLRELTLRLHALTRRCSDTEGDQSIRCGALEIDPIFHTALVTGQKLALTPKEFALIEYMGRHHDNVLSISSMIEEVWEKESDVSPDTVRAYIKRLRAKLDKFGHKGLVENVPGIGYKLCSTTGDGSSTPSVPLTMQPTPTFA